MLTRPLPPHKKTFHSTVIILISYAQTAFLSRVFLFIFELQLTRPAHSLLGINVSCSEGGKDDRAERPTEPRQ